MQDLIIKIRISPNASKNEIIKSNNEVKIKLTAQPIEGKANKALIEFLSKEFHIPKTFIIIAKGANTKEKTIVFSGVDEEKIKKIQNALL